MNYYKIIKKYGLIDFVNKLCDKLIDPVNSNYKRFYRNVLCNIDELEKQAEMVFDKNPLISIVVPTYNTEPSMFWDMICSVEKQTYKNWQLCIVDASSNDYIQKNYKEKLLNNPQIDYIKVENRGISKNTNEGLEKAKGEYIALLDHDDMLAPEALFFVVQALNNYENVNVIYSDEDKISEDGKKLFCPHYKTDYNRELLNHYNYFCHLLVFRKDLVEKIGGLDQTYDGAQDYDFVLRLCDYVAPCSIIHIPRILYHWRVSEHSTASSGLNKEYAYAAAVGAVQSHLNRVTRGNNGVSAMPINSREYVEIQRTYVTEQDILYINNGLEINEKEKRKLVSFFSPDGSDIGVVGCAFSMKGKLLNCGLSYTKQGDIIQMFHSTPKWSRGYYKRCRLSSEVSGVLLQACAIREDLFQKIGGIDYSLPPYYRDLDFCFKVREAGYKIIIDPSIVIEMPKNKMVVFPKERNSAFNSRWGEYLSKGDPFYREYSSIGCDGNI